MSLQKLAVIQCSGQFRYVVDISAILEEVFARKTRTSRRNKHGQRDKAKCCC